MLSNWCRGFSGLGMGTGVSWLRVISARSWSVSWRDSATAGRHAVIMPSVNQEVYGKALLGVPLEDNITPLI